MLTLAAIGIGTGFLTAAGDVRMLRQPLIRLVFSVLFLVFGFWIFYVGIRHVVAD